MQIELSVDEYHIFFQNCANLTKLKINQLIFIPLHPAGSDCLRLESLVGFFGEEL